MTYAGLTDGGACFSICAASVPIGMRWREADDQPTTASS